MGCAWVMAETSRIWSSLASVKASGAMRMSEPLPFDRSCEQPKPWSSAVTVALPTSKTLPSAE